jgi:NADH dehydrogenase [ubiquinone] 1 alpha subcomplex assembly factor 7
VWGPAPQSHFLKQLGAAQRLAALSARASSAQRRQLEGGLERLLDPEQMGTLFKVLALTSPGLSAPPGFDQLDRMR